jgi:hypothetical protein
MFRFGDRKHAVFLREFEKPEKKARRSGPAQRKR